MISQPNSSLNQTLPPLRTLFPDSVFKPVNVQNPFLIPLRPKLTKHSSAAAHLPPARNTSTNRRSSRASNSSTPPLSFSPSPSPELQSSAEFSLVPCSLNEANAVVTAHLHSGTTSVTLLVGPAMQRAIKEDCKLHPYRIVRRN